MPTAEDRRRAAAEHARSIIGDLPQFDPEIGQVDPFRAPSIGDAFTDPRFLQAAAQRQRSMRGAAEASGLRGAPVLAAQEASRRAALNEVANRLFGERLQEWGAGFNRAQDQYRRYAGDWGRQWAPTQAAIQYGLQDAGIDLGQRAQALGAQAQQFGQWWQPMQQLRAFTHAADMQGAGFGHQAALQAAAHAHAAAQQERQFGHSRWLTGQQNLLALLQAIYGQQFGGLAPAMA